MARKQAANTHNIVEISKQATKNQLRLRIDDLLTFKPLTDNQSKFFEAYRQGD